MQSKSSRSLQLSPEHELLRMLAPPQAEELTTLDWDTIERNYPEKVRKLSARRKGMTLGDALSIGKPVT